MSRSHGSKAEEKGERFMSADENVAIARRVFAEQDRRKGPVPPELCAPDYTAHIAGFPPMDLSGHTELAKVFFAAFPDLTQTIDDAFGDGEKVALRCTITATHQGELMGMAPTGKRITIASMAMFRIVDGKVAELHEIFDQMSLMQQLGAIPAPGQPAA
jgi:predicted ester cyclase